MSNSAELQVAFEPLTDKSLSALKLLNGVIFPIKYQDQLYRDCMACGDITQLAYHDGVLVGAIAARCEMQPGGTGKARMYIASLGVLAPYRGHRIGSQLLQRSLEAIAEDENVVEAYLHVQGLTFAELNCLAMQVDNDDAVRFYKRFGFEARETIPNYYKRLDPPDALLLVKVLR